MESTIWSRKMRAPPKLVTASTSKLEAAPNRYAVSERHAVLMSDSRSGGSGPGTRPRRNTELSGDLRPASQEERRAALLRAARGRRLQRRSPLLRLGPVGGQRLRALLQRGGAVRERRRGRVGLARRSGR